MIGFGSDALTDDGLPIHLVRDLQNKYPGKSMVFATSPVGGMELINLLEGFDTALLIDTQMTGRREHGAITEFGPDDFAETYHLSSQHDVSFHDALRLANLMEIPMPGAIQVVAIEISDNKTLSFELSDQIRDKYPSILYYLCRVIEKITGKDDQQVLQ